MGRGAVVELEHEQQAEVLRLSQVRVVVAQPRGLRRDAAAAYVGLKTTKFDELVDDGRMPKPFRVDGCVLWDVRKLDLAFDALSDDAPRKRFPWD